MEFCVDVLYLHLMQYGSSHCVGAYMCVPIIKCLTQHLFIKIRTWAHVLAMLSSHRYYLFFFFL